MLAVVILAGGLATRLAPLSKNIPKSLVPCLNKPFLSYQLALLRKQGIKQIHLCVGRFSQQIRQYLLTLATDDFEFFVHDEGEQPIGTAAALRRALPNLPQQFFLMYGDSYLTCDFFKVQQQFYLQAKPALMTVYYNQNGSDRSNVIFQNQQIKQYNKKQYSPQMLHIDYGLAVFDQAIFNRYNYQDLSDMYQALVSEQLLAAYEVKQPYYEVGSFSGLASFEAFLAN